MTRTPSHDGFLRATSCSSQRIPLKHRHLKKCLWHLPTCWKGEAMTSQCQCFYIPRIWCGKMRRPWGYRLAQVKNWFIQSCWEYSGLVTSPQQDASLSHIVTIYRDQDPKNLFILYPIGSMYGMVSYMFSITNHYGWDFHIFHDDDYGSVAFHYDHYVSRKSKALLLSHREVPQAQGGKLRQFSKIRMIHPCLAGENHGKPWKICTNK